MPTVIPQRAFLTAIAIPVRNTLLQLWRVPGVNRFVSQCLRYAPAPLRGYVERERLRVRLRDRIIAVPKVAYGRVLQRGLDELIKRTGDRERLGDYLEFGVYNGTSLLTAFRQTAAMELSHMRLFGFDSFEGLPPEAADDDGGKWAPGAWSCDLPFTRAVLESEGVDWRRVTLVPGWFSQTCTAETARRHHITKASVIMIDCDIYSSAQQALRFCAPLIQDVALIMFDDWHAGQLAEKNLGEKKAFEEFLADWPCFSAERFESYGTRAETVFVTRK